MEKIKKHMTLYFDRELIIKIDDIVYDHRLKSRSNLLEPIIEQGLKDDKLLKKIVDSVHAWKEKHKGE